MTASAIDCDRREQIALLEAEKGRLSPEDESFLTVHLSTCRDCRLEQEVYSAMRYVDGHPHFQVDPLARVRTIEAAVSNASKSPKVREFRMPRQIMQAIRPRNLAVAAAIAIIAGVVGILMPRLMPHPSYDGHVLLAAGAARSEEGRATAGQVVSEGQILETEDGELSVALPTGINFLLDKNSRVRVNKLSEADIELELVSGMMSASVDPKRHGPHFGVQTRTGRVQITGTIFALVDNDGGAVDLRVLRGKVMVFEGSKTTPRAVKASEASRLSSGETRSLSVDEESSLMEASRRLNALADSGAVTVDLASEPKNAKLRLNGEFIGHTPLSARVPAGDYELELSAASVQGLVFVRDRVHLEAGERLQRTYGLNVANGTVDSKGVKHAPVR